MPESTYAHCRGTKTLYLLPFASIAPKSSFLSPSNCYAKCVSQNNNHGNGGVIVYQLPQWEGNHWVILSDKQGGNGYHFQSLWYDPASSSNPEPTSFRVDTLPSDHWANFWVDKRSLSVRIYSIYLWNVISRFVVICTICRGSKPTSLFLVFSQFCNNSMDLFNVFGYVTVRNWKGEKRVEIWKAVVTFSRDDAQIIKIVEPSQFPWE